MRTETAPKITNCKRITVTREGDYWGTFAKSHGHWITDTKIRRRVLTLYDGQLIDNATINPKVARYDLRFPSGNKVHEHMNIRQMHRLGDDILWITFGFRDDQIQIHRTSHVARL